MESILPLTQFGVGFSSNSSKLSLQTKVEKVYKEKGGSTPLHVLWAKEYLTILNTKYAPRERSELINFCLDSFKSTKPVLPDECGSSRLFSEGKEITILGVCHTRSVGTSKSDKEAVILTWIQLNIREQKPHAVFLEAGMGNPRLTPQQKVIDQLRYETSLQNLRNSPSNTDSEMYFTGRRALAQNPDCSIYNMEPLSISEELIEHSSLWHFSENDFRKTDFCIASRSAAMLQIYMGNGKYEGCSIDDFKAYIINKDSNSIEKWTTSFEIMKRYIHDFELIITNPARHLEIKKFSAPSKYVSNPTILNRISDVSCQLREDRWKKTILDHGKASTLVVCGASHRDSLAKLFT
jgi:hypothetical protein